MINFSKKLKYRNLQRLQLQLVQTRFDPSKTCKCPSPPALSLTGCRFCDEHQGQTPIAMNSQNPKKLLLTKWTAVKTMAKQKHFLVSRMIQPEQPTDSIESVVPEAVFSKAVQVIAWRELKDDSVWQQGWV